ncbi:Hypothetical conserved protein OS=uncultured planctomycete GN=HGMM_F07G10C08 PE=4 SV=1 [Gemmataceae bacterium]|nr:Hypothetical conserved protein OS=uncultured planctomycete GN=HGMM_F07G10C08 PE=4 SV=1 [Gemmataceae bacterium]VTU01080.1 Hypothetical conserved protein OS=uncultured planctomycete GN=HGMM_F07G10C08 PE=4 SV=1 [Gemmataceae bacterium]
MLTPPLAIADLLAAPPTAPLGPGEPVASARAKLAALTDESLGAVADRDMAACCRSGLWLAFNYLDESHTISQDVGTTTGSFWHAIMHRREPDAWNSKYWWNRVGPHPVLALLREQAPTVGYTFTTPEAFVDFCEKVRGTGSGEEELAQRVQMLEWRLLFDWCWQRSVTGADR